VGREASQESDGITLALEVRKYGEAEMMVLFVVTGEWENRLGIRACSVWQYRNFT
jgi:hypothetical protein